MLNKIIYYSLHNRLVVLICSLLLMIAGTYTAFHTDVDVFPDLNAPTVVIMTEANGMAPATVSPIIIISPKMEDCGPSVGFPTFSGRLSLTTAN